MRELKFRSWNDEKYKYAPNRFVYTDDYDKEDVDDYESIGHFFATRDNIEQYTGLKDKNGKEIYEGDIVNMPSSECAVVDYDAGSFTLNCSHCSATWTMDRWCSELGIGLDNICKSIEVIGNIHENGDLLK